VKKEIPVSLLPEIRETEIPAVLEIHTPLFSDARGFFSESYNRDTWVAAGFRETFVQDNVSLSSRGVLRGLHYQLHPHGMGKLVRAITGAVYDVAVDLRRGSPTFGRWVARTLEEGVPLWLWIPVGFAHGFVALRDNTRVYYKCTGVYHGESERAIRHDDADLNITWPVPVEIISEKDANAPPFKKSEHNFT
jgi:dTDP-4-dehydrorhamnose 3,5-epimerase